MTCLAACRWHVAAAGVPPLNCCCSLKRVHSVSPTADERLQGSCKITSSCLPMVVAWRSSHVNNITTRFLTPYLCITSCLRHKLAVLFVAIIRFGTVNLNSTSTKVYEMVFIIFNAVIARNALTQLSSIEVCCQRLVILCVNIPLMTLCCKVNIERWIRILIPFFKHGDDPLLRSLHYWPNTAYQLSFLE